MTGAGPSEPLTRELAMQRLDSLAAADVRETISVADNPYIVAAAVRSTYELTDLPVAEGAGGEDLQALLEASKVVDDDAGGLTWMLRGSVRRKAFAGLGQREAILRACKEYEAPDDPLQKTLIAQLRPTSSPLEQQSQHELALTLQVTEWLSGIVPTADDPAAVRRRLDLELLLEPFRYLVGDHFAGREKELTTLREYVGVLRSGRLSGRTRRRGRALAGLVTEPPLVVSGVGGIGKSTLLAKFLLEHTAVGAQPLPFAYLDFDRSSVEAANPATVLVEAARQLAVQAEHDREGWEADRRRWAAAIRGVDHGASPSFMQATSQIVDRRLHPRLIREFSNRLEKTFGPQTPLLLVLDTFEEVQYRSKTYVSALWDFLAELQEGVWQLRTVIAGRAPIPDQDTKDLELPELDERAATGYLRFRGISDAETARFITKRFGGNPLTLRLASDIVKQDEGSVETLRGVKRRKKALRGLSAGQETVQRALYTRILAHIHDEQVRSLAHPGLALRRITGDLILNVLAEPCGIAVGSVEEAQTLLDKLREEVSLVRTSDDGGVEHRSDLRRLMLPMLVADHPDKIRDIHDRAVAYYSDRRTPADRAEEIYHRLSRGDSIEEVDARWIDGLGDRLAPAVPELPPGAQVYLASRVGVELKPDVLTRATIGDHIRVLQRRAQQLLATGDIDGALGVLQPAVAEYGPRMSLAVMLATAQYRMGRHLEAIETIDRALAELHEDADSRLSLQLEELAARIDEDNGRLTAAAERVQEAYELARWLGEPAPVLSLGARWLTLQRDVNRESISEVAARVYEALERVDDDALIADPELAWALAGQLGDAYPEVLLRVGKAVGFPMDLPADGVFGLAAALSVEGQPAPAEVAARPTAGAISNLNVHTLLTASDALERAGGLVAALLRDRAAHPSRRLASSISVSVQFPDAEVRAVDGISFDDHERWWVVYVANSGREPIGHVSVRTIQPVNRTYEFEMDDVHPGRAWYILPPESEMYVRDEPPGTRVEFTALGRRYRMSERRLDALVDGEPVPVTFSEQESREVAEHVRVWIDRPDEQVRTDDRLDTSENWWVVYMATDGDRPVHRVIVRLDGAAQRLEIRFPPIEPGRRRWWIIRPDSGFELKEPIPQVRVEFDALGRRWRRTSDGLERVESE